MRVVGLLRGGALAALLLALPRLSACDAPARPKADPTSEIAHVPPLPPSAPQSACSVPEPSPNIGNMEREGADSVAEQVRRVFRAHVSESQACWRSAYLRRDPDAGEVAKFVVSFRVARGSARDISSSGEPPGYPGLSACVIANLARWRFPRARDFPMQIPFVFAGPPRLTQDETESAPTPL